MNSLFKNLKKLMIAGARFKMYENGLAAVEERMEVIKIRTQKMVVKLIVAIVLGIIALIFLTSGWIFLLLAVFFTLAGLTSINGAALICGLICIGITLLLLVIALIIK